jgi:hypothetical protein
MNYIYDQFGIRRKLSDIRAVDNLFRLKRNNQTDPWPVIDEILNIWEKKVIKANQWNSYLFELESTKETRKNKYAASDSRKDPVHGGIMRYILDIPEFVVNAIRMVYSPTELPMDKGFSEAFARRYPKFRVAEKI